MRSHSHSTGLGHEKANYWHRIARPARAISVSLPRRTARELSPVALLRLSVRGCLCRACRDLRYGDARLFEKLAQTKRVRCFFMLHTFKSLPTDAGVSLTAALTK